jgi:signal transduction histidine kinase/type II secretory pathway pseudopilin PulG
MKWSKRSLIELIAAVLMIAVVIVLALLQFRWTGQISRSDQNRLKDVLNSGLRSFNEDFSYDFQRLCETFEVSPVQKEADISAPISRQYAVWANSGPRSSLVSAIYIWKSDSPSVVAVTTDGSQKVAWPSSLQSLRGPLKDRAANLQAELPDRQAEYYPWAFYSYPPALVRPLFQVASEDSSLPMTAKSVGFLIVKLDGDFLKRDYLPGLVDRNFTRLGFDAAIRTAAAPYRALYASTSSFPIATESPDASLVLIGAVSEASRRRGHAPVEPANLATQWELVALHESGSLDQAVGEWRRRNLLISFGLLAILASSLVLVFSLARRAERFAELQMEFVAGISHELCTPLAVINSAVENLADGVVDSPDQTREYVALLRDQGGRLERLLSQVLQFASARFSPSELNLQPLDIAAVVAQSLAGSESLLREADLKIEQQIQPDLPLVNADADAAQKCVENLINNAIKYGGAGGSILMKACLNRLPSQSEVQVVVEDHGIGISPQDQRKIFEPFYRTSEVREGQFRGVGLGLFLVKGMMETMGGSITVFSELGRGTRFVLHFPVAASVDQPKEAPAQSRGTQTVA